MYKNNALYLWNKTYYYYYHYNDSDLHQILESQGFVFRIPDLNYSYLLTKGVLISWQHRQHRRAAIDRKHPCDSTVLS